MKLLNRLHHAEIIIPRGREAQAREFYCGFLGLVEIPKPAEVSSKGGLWLQLGDNQIHLSIEDGYDPARTRVHLAYEVSDLSYLERVLKDHGFELSRSAPIAGFIRGTFRDPFGNRIELLQPERQAEPSDAACPPN